MKRLGGGFGGKESRGSLVALPAAIAAYKLNRPVRCMLDRDEDMLISGTRHPFYMKYKTAFDNDGKILGCEIWIYNNAGYSFDLSTAVSSYLLLSGVIKPQVLGFRESDLSFPKRLQHP